MVEKEAKMNRIERNPQKTWPFYEYKVKMLKMLIPKRGSNSGGGYTQKNK